MLLLLSSSFLPQDIVTYFTSPSLLYSVEGFANDADFMIACVSGTIPSPVIGWVGETGRP